MRNKKRHTGLWTAGMVLLALGGAVLGQVRSGAYSSRKGESLAQAGAKVAEAEADYSVAPFPSLPVDLADGEGRAETESFCTPCHSTRYITMQPPLPAPTWEAEMNKMIKTYGAQITEAPAKKILAYLQSHYTPENRKP